MALTMLSFKVPAELIEHYDILAAELSVPRSELMRKALERGRDANPVDDLARERHRKRKAQGQKTVKVGADGSFTTVATERPDIAATRELAQRTYGGGASLAAEGGEARYRRGEGRKRREGESLPSVHTLLSLVRNSSRPAREYSSRPAARPSVRPSDRHLRAV